MKKKLTIVLAMFTLFAFLTSTNAFAHEMYFTQSGSTITTIPLRWTPKNTSTGRLKVIINKQSLTGSWSTYYEDARTAWHSSAVPAEFTTTTTTPVPNTYMVTASQQYWDSMYPDGPFSETLGVTELYDTNSLAITSIATASASTKQLKGANIYLNPSPNSPSAFIYRFTMSHELGHVLALGHSHLPQYSPANTSTDPSIMSYDYFSLGQSYLPQNHEVNDVKKMYGY
ncbi:hypothetical protein H8B09_25175 [Paenibacillus sp. PR3]|uniref:Peptidase metallopeptidase domain-containing protein n=1 Tax=Paenibacillus terricola TaxID=2763503 RepID=A0ABR8N5G4_9BACL|nr:hypothetical protein [Paenibacillus terricola]MBD3922079.1 hypothetical protein [Paenibacillus terricola]